MKIGLLLLLLPGIISAQTLLDAWSGERPDFDGMTDTSAVPSWSYSAGTNRVFVCAMASERTSGNFPAYDSWTWGSEAATSLVVISGMDGAGVARARLEMVYWLEADLPASGSAMTITWSTSSTSERVNIGCATYQGVDQTSPFPQTASNDTAAGSASYNAASTTLTDAANSIGIAAAMTSVDANENFSWTTWDEMLDFSAGFGTSLGVGHELDDFTAPAVTITATDTNAYAGIVAARMQGIGTTEAGSLLHHLIEEDSCAIFC